MVGFFEVEALYFMEIVKRPRLVTLGCHVQAVQSVLVEDKLVGSFFEKHLTYFDVAVE